MICLVVEILCSFAWRDSLVSEAGDSFSTWYSPALLCTYGPKILTCCYRTHECTAFVLKWQRPCRLGPEVACGMSKGRTVADIGLWPLIKIFAVTTTDFALLSSKLDFLCLEQTQTVVLGLLSHV